MKKILYIIIFFLSRCYPPTLAQTIDTVKTKQISDSVKKYRDISTFYLNTSNHKWYFFYEQMVFYKNKLDSANYANIRFKDSLTAVNRKKYLETKYHIKLK